MAKKLHFNDVKKDFMNRLKLDKNGLKNSYLYNFMSYLSDFEVKWDFNKISLDDIYYDKDIYNSEVVNTCNDNSYITMLLIFFKYDNLEYVSVQVLLGGDVRLDSNYSHPMILRLKKDEFYDKCYSYVSKKVVGDKEYEVFPLATEGDINCFCLFTNEYLGNTNDIGYAEEFEIFERCAYKTNLDVFLDKREMVFKPADNKINYCRIEDLYGNIIAR